MHYLQFKNFTITLPTEIQMTLSTGAVDHTTTTAATVTAVKD